jgi:Asp-tRNA(Asn)/Glu-tRNA(Gln) amidotransferase A subunit family amidase
MTYTPQHLNSPRLAGAALKAFTAVADMPIAGCFLKRSMLKAAGIPAFRAIESRDAAIVVPPLPAGSDLGDLFEDEQGDAGGNDQVELPKTAQGTCALADQYRDGSTTPQEIAERFLEAVTASDRASPALRAFIAIDAADVRKQARQSTARWRESRPLGPLDGVPVAVKDELDQVPYPTTVGTKFLGRQPASSDATVVGRLRAAGALLVGKTNMHEIGMGITGVNPHHGTSRNPYDPARITGGSSSGSAAAVAAGMCPIAVSADAGGSIRIPAALCGVVGLKPTFGRMSERGAATLCWSIAHLGVIGATASEVASAYLAMAGQDDEDANTLRQPLPRLGHLDNFDLTKLTIGFVPSWFEDADPPVVAACQQVLSRLGKAGARVREIEIPDLNLVRPVHFVTAATEWAAAFAHRYDTDRRAFGGDVRLMLLLARSLDPADYVHAQRLRRRICSNFETALKAVDVIATPTTAGTAPLVPLDAIATGECDLVTLDRMTRFVTASNLTGLPAISFPAGYDGQGLPIGIQMIGRAWREDVLLRLAAATEPFVERRLPRLHYTLHGNR